MKKNIFVLIILTILLVPTFNVYASNINSNETINNNEILIQNKINEFLEIKNKDDVFSLTLEEEQELTKFIQNYKETINLKSNIMAVEPWDYATTYNIMGYIFGSMDAHLSSIYHGHVGIGHSAGGNVIEANPNDGVKLYINRVSSFWADSETGGIYSINGATYNNYLTATNYAINRLGKDYGFDPIADDFYCSELVYYAWDSAGYNVASSRVWGTPILPSQIMNDGDTILEASFPIN